MTEILLPLKHRQCKSCQVLDLYPVDARLCSYCGCNLDIKMTEEKLPPLQVNKQCINCDLVILCSPNMKSCQKCGGVLFNWEKPIPVNKQCEKCGEIELHTPSSIHCKCGGILTNWQETKQDPLIKESKPVADTGILNDPVNHPSHYTQSSIECIDAMEAMLSPEEFRGFLRGNSFKYRWRYRDKNGVEDLKKAMWYEERLLKLEKENEIPTK